MNRNSYYETIGFKGKIIHWLHVRGVFDVRFTTSGRDPINQCLSMIWKHPHTTISTNWSTNTNQHHSNTCVNFPVCQTNRANWKALGTICIWITCSLSIQRAYHCVWLYLISHISFWAMSLVDFPLLHLKCNENLSKFIDFHFGWLAEIDCFPEFSSNAIRTHSEPVSNSLKTKKKTDLNRYSLLY